MSEQTRKYAVEHQSEGFTFLALSAYSSLTSLQARWSDVMSRRADRKENELKEGLHSIRASCLRSFPEVLADIRLAGLGKGGEIGTGLAEFTISVRLSLLCSSCTRSLRIEDDRLSSTLRDCLQYEMLRLRRCLLSAMVTGRWVRARR